MKTTDIAIVGGGLQGMMLCRHLHVRAGLTPENLLLLDPKPPGYWWCERVKDCDTSHLRSGPRDHVDCDPESLLRFAERFGRLEVGFATSERRPCVKLFNEHLGSVAEALREFHLSAKVHDLTVRRGQPLLLSTSVGTVSAGRVVLSLGPGTPNYPDWAKPFRLTGRVTHIFDQNFERTLLPAGTRIALIGGGISAIQVALALAKEDHQVCLYTRRELGEKSASDPTAWTTTGLLRELRSLGYEDRYQMLATHGDKGTLPEWETERLQSALGAGTLRHRVCQISQCELRADCLRLQTDAEEIECDIVVLATGFSRTLPDWLKQAALTSDLPLTRRGDPVLSDELQWGAGTKLFVTGGYAAPILGPYADNMFGGRMAVEILAEALFR